MKKLVIALLCMLVSSCSLWTAVKHDVTADIDCIKTQEKLANAGLDAFEIATKIGESLSEAVATAVATGGDVMQALDAAAAPWIKLYGEPVVACFAHANDPTATGSGSAASAVAPNLVTEWIGHKGWHFAKR